MLALIDGMQETPELIDAFLSEDIRRTASPPPPNEPAPSILSEREREVAGLVAKGLHNREIANQLTISVHTVERHLSNIFGRTGVRSRAELASYAVRNKLA
jgi:DNA-binding NarL/FixJ family response regulator